MKDAALASIKRVAILDFTDAPGADAGYSGRVVAGVMTGQALRVPSWQISERERIAQILEEQSFQRSSAVDVQTAVEIGRILGVDAVIVGTVSQYRIGSIPFLFFLAFDKDVYRVSFNFRLIKVETAEVCLSADVSDTSLKSLEDAAVKASSAVFDKISERDLSIARRASDTGALSSAAPLEGPAVSQSNLPAADLGPDYGRRVAVVIGINEYAHWPVLEGAASDARRVANEFRRFGFDEVIELYDREGTRTAILDALGTDLSEKTGSNDLAVIYFAGHGQTETLSSGKKRGYVIPVDSDPSRVFATAISMDTLRDLSDRIPAKHIYYVMDSCYSGLGFVRGLAPTPKGAGYVRKMTSRRAVQMITAGGEGEEAIEAGGQGLFTAKLLEAWSGDADFDGDGFVTASELGTYVKPQVSAASDQRQTPQFGTLQGSGEVVFQLR
jgi:hypothetical protein